MFEVSASSFNVVGWLRRCCCCWTAAAMSTATPTQYSYPVSRKRILYRRYL